jgi:hypothetical protein
MQSVRNVLEIILFPIQLSLVAVCWGYMVSYVIIRLKEIKTQKLNENEAN